MCHWINLELYNSFQPELREIFDEVAAETAEWYINEVEEQTVVNRKIWEDSGATFYQLSEADKMAWAALLPDLPAQWAKDTEALGLPGWEIVDTYIQLTEEAGHTWPREWGQR